jgi:hypothetical protein
LIAAGNQSLAKFAGTVFAVKILPERRSGSKTFTGTAFRAVPAPLHH